MELKRMQELSLQEQDSLVAGSNAQAECTCAKCSCNNEQGNYESTDLGKWGGVSVANNS